MQKILPLETLKEILDDLREQGRRIVLCHGCFDLLHIGHIRYFRQAAALGDVLVVTLTPDGFVDKGPARPAFSQDLRAEQVASQNIVDYVAIARWPTAVELLDYLRPDVYAKGADFKSIDSDPTGKLRIEADACEAMGIEFRLTEDIVFSSTNLINRFLSNYSEEVQEYLSLFRSRYSLDDLDKVLDSMQGLKVTLVGDTILDEYQYCSPLGASSKEPVLALKHLNGDLFAGGVLAVANHLSNFVKEVRLFSVLGEGDPHEEFVRSSLNANVVPHFAYQKEAPTTRKQRYVEGYSMSKMIEIYYMDDSGLDAERDADFCRAIRESFSSDLMIAADFGHGAISADCRGVLCDSGKFLAVNVQANAGNRGFHTISCYDRCDFISLAETELRLDTRDKLSGVNDIASVVRENLGAAMVATTRGKQGAMIISRDGSEVLVPAFVHKVLDRIGSGDAFFSIASLAAYLELHPELVAFLGNVVGSIAVGIVGNKKSITRDDVMKHITSLIK